MTFLHRSLVVATLLLVSSTSAPAQIAAPEQTVESGRIELGEGCSGGVVFDDGSLETGYGWVPSVVEGRYVQRFEVGDFRSRMMEEVCICWTRTLPDDEIRFEVQLYRDRAGTPALWPVASVEAVATQVPEFPDGAFYTVDVSGAGLHAVTDAFYVGVTWDPSEDGFFFVCADQSDSSPTVEGWFIDDRSEEWASVLGSADPIFDEHRAMMIRARAAEGFYPLVPTMGPVGILVMAAVIALIAAALLRRRE